MTLKERIGSLSAEQQRQLYYAFEHDISQYVEVGESQFIGVNVGNTKNLRVVDSAGVWAFGNIQGRFEL